MTLCPSHLSESARSVIVNSSLFYIMKDWACEFALLFSLTQPRVCVRELVQRCLVRVILFLDRECLSRVKVFVFFFKMSFVHCFPFLHFAIILYISLIYDFLKENSNNFKFTFQLQQPNENNQG